METTKAPIQQESYFSPEFMKELRHTKLLFIQNVLPSIRDHRHFVSPGERRRNKHLKSIAHSRNSLAAIRFSPLAMTLGQGIATQQHQITPSQSAPIFIPRPVIVQPNTLVSVFIIAVIKSSPELFVLQKVQHKFAPGFPGGGIETKETILTAATREFLEESRGPDKLAGIDISRYNPTCIGTFTLNRATNNEQGAVVLVEIPEEESDKIVAGGGDQEGEVVEAVYFWTFDEVLATVSAGRILPNSVKIWEVYLEYLVS